MTADEFVKIVRSGSEKLRVDEIVINTGRQTLHGKGNAVCRIQTGMDLPRVRKHRCHYAHNAAKR